MIIFKSASDTQGFLFIFSFINNIYNVFYCYKGFIVAEESILFEVDNFSAIEGMLSLIASYYILHIGYPTRSLRAASFLLFLQEMIVGIHEPTARKTSKYNKVIDLVKD